MSYHLYHTDAFVLKSAPRGEANTLFTLFTRELGLITVTATSVREERSKLRYGLSDFSLSSVTLVRGRDSWRLTGATFGENVRTVLRDNTEAVRLCARIFKLLERLLAGEEKNEQLFEAVAQAFRFLHSAPAVSVAEIEIVLVLRILHLLGYLAPRGEFAGVLSDSSLWDDRLLIEAREFRTLALADINHSLKATQL